MEMFALAAYRSRQAVLRFDEELTRAGIQTQIVTTPQAVALGCGLSVRFAWEDTEKALETYRLRPDSNLIGFYLVYTDGAKIQVTPIRV